MAKKEGSPDLGHASAFDPAEFAAMTKKRIEDFVNAQSEVLGKFQETNREWLDRLQSEATLTSELASKLTAARSIPDAMTACQNWTNRRLEMMAEDGRHVLADSQKFMEVGTRLVFDGWLSRSGAST